jgi:hypothetical protein
MNKKKASLLVVIFYAKLSPINLGPSESTLDERYLLHKSK